MDKMPEGFNRLNDLAWYLSNIAPLDYSKKIFQSLDLMKEMAEALEDIQNTIGLGYQFPNAQEALRKFKEWK